MASTGKVKTEDIKEKRETNELESQENGFEYKHTTPVRKLRYIRAFVMELFCVVLIFYIFCNYIFGLNAAPNDDMYPLAASGDLLIYYRLDKDVLAKDVIVFEDGGVLRVGRVVGKENDSIEITDSGNVIVNGNSIVEPNIHNPTYPFEGYIDYPLTLKEGECFVLCDVRNGTEDSRYFGPVPKKSIKGTVIAVIRRYSL